MTNDKIAEMRARHKAVHELIEYDLPSQMHDDRDMLLTEVDRREAEIERLTRERDEARAEVERLSEVISTLEIVGKAADDERQNMRKEIERLRAESANNDWLLAEAERLQGLLKTLSRDMAEEVERLTRERDEARAENEQLREALITEAEERR